MKLKLFLKNSSVIFFMIFLVSSCVEKQEDKPDVVKTRLENEKLFESTVLKHLNAVSNKDINTLKSTMSPKGNMQLILPSTEIIESVDGFVKYHEDWFKIPNWTFETKLLNTKIGNELGMAIVEIVYREPERDGKPYFNRMIVSYDLEKIDGNWYFIKDHASSVEKSTDVKE